MLAVLVVAASGCGTEVAASPQARPTAPGPSWATPVPVRTPTPTPPPQKCPPSGAMITVGEVEAALGHRAVVLKLTNCRARTLTLDGYPEVAVLDARRNKLKKVAVAHGSSYMATDPGPARIRLGKGESALAAVSWSNTVEVYGGAVAGTYLSVAQGKGDAPVVWPVVTDIGTTGKVELTAWLLKFAN